MLFGPEPQELISLCRGILASGGAARRSIALLRIKNSIIDKPDLPSQTKRFEAESTAGADGRPDRQVPAEVTEWRRKRAWTKRLGSTSFTMFTPGGAKAERELPFVVGVLADLSGDPETPLPRLRDRKFVEIDKNNFDSVLAAVRPRIKIDVPNTLQGEDDASRLRVDLNISRLEDFEPEPLARQIPELRELLEGRDRLAYLLAKAELSPTFGEALSDIIKETEKRKAHSDESLPGRPASSKEGS